MAKERHQSCSDISFPGKIHEMLEIVKNICLLRKLIQKERFSVIHCNGSPDHWLVIYTLLTLPRGQRPSVVCTKHNSLEVYPTLRNKLRYVTFCNGVIVVCPFQGRQFARLGVSNETLFFVRHSVDTEKFSPRSRANKLRLRHILAINPSKIVLVSCSGTGAHKGWHFLANALNDLSPDLREIFSLLVLGQVPSEQTRRRLMNNPEMKEVFFPGVMKDVRPYLWASDVGFVLSTSETTSYACREMMACGLPALVSNAGCLADNVDRSSGWVVPAASVGAVSKILRLIATSDLATMGAAARKRAVTLFCYKSFRIRTFEVYQHAADRGSP